MHTLESFHTSSCLLHIAIICKSLITLSSFYSYTLYVQLPHCHISFHIHCMLSCTLICLSTHTCIHAFPYSFSYFHILMQMKSNTHAYMPFHIHYHIHMPNMHSCHSIFIIKFLYFHANEVKYLYTHSKYHIGLIIHLKIIFLMQVHFWAV